MFLLRREMAGWCTLAYVAAQLAGAALGVLAAHAMFDAPPLLQVATKVRSGLAQSFSESVATFSLVLTVLLTLRS